MWLGTQTREIVAERDDIAQTQTCSICGVVFKAWGHNEAWGHNAQPINDGKCCDDCNGLVVARRIQLATNQLRPGDQWQQLVDRIGLAAARKKWVAKTVRATVMKRVAQMKGTAITN